MMNDNPPKGVIAPIHLKPVMERKYKLPEKRQIPAIKNMDGIFILEEYICVEITDSMNYTHSKYIMLKAKTVCEFLACEWFIVG